MPDTLCSATGRPDITPPIVSARTYDVTRDLLLTEPQVRASANATAESILHQGRMALITVLAGLVALISRRACNAKNQPTEHDFKPPRWLVWG